MFKAYKYRIYPTPEQVQKIEQTFGVCRLVYNLGLQIKRDAWNEGQNNVSRFDLDKQLKDLKKECPWVAGVEANAISAALKNMDAAYVAFFKGGGYPKFKSKRGTQSFQSRQSISIHGNKLNITKIKNIPIVLSRELAGKIKNVTISKTPTGKYFASILVNTPEVPPNKPTVVNAVGIDLGIKDFAITSAGVVYNNPKHLKSNLDRLKILQRRASRKKKGSANRKKANLRVAILHERITNQRLDFLHKVTSGLVRDNQADTFVIEDLNVKGMISNHKLAQAISDVSWAKFRELLTYKCEWYGKNLIVIDRFAPSSKTCSCCGSVKELTLADRTYECESCGLVLDRDLNAAINIKQFGLSGLGKPGEPSEVPVITRTNEEGIV